VRGRNALTIAVDVIGQRARRADDTVAGRDDRDGVLTVGGANGTRRARPSHLLRDLSIRARLAKGNREQGLPHGTLKRRAGEVELQVERPPASREVLAELALGLEQHRVPRILDVAPRPRAPLAAAFEPDSRKSLVSGQEAQRSHRRIHQFEDVS